MSAQTNAQVSWNWNPPKCANPSQAFCDHAEQIMDPHSCAAKRVRRPPHTQGMSTAAAHNRVIQLGKCGDTFDGGVQQAGSLAGEHFNICSAGLKYAALTTYGAPSTTVDGVLTGKIRVLANTPSSIMASGDPLTFVDGSGFTHFMIPRRYFGVPNAGAVQAPIYAVDVPTSGGAVAVSVLINMSIVRVSDDTSFDNAIFYFNYRNASTQVWTSQVCGPGGGQPNSPLGAINPISFNTALGLSVDAISFFWTNNNYTDMEYEIRIQMNSGINLCGYPNVGAHCYDNPLPLSADWDVNSAAIVGASVWTQCTASDLKNGGEIGCVDLRHNVKPGDLNNGGGIPGLSQVPWAHNGRFRDGSYGFLSPTLDQLKLHCPVTYFTDNVIFTSVYAADRTADFQVKFDFVFQGTSVSPMYEYAMPDMIQGYDGFLEYMRTVPHCMDNIFHGGVINKVKGVVASPAFSKAVGATAAVANKAASLIPNPVARKVTQKATGAVAGAAGKRTAKLKSLPSTGKKGGPALPPPMLPRR